MDEAYDSAIVINPYYSKAFYNKGILFAVMNDDRNAIINLDIAIQIDLGETNANKIVVTRWW